MPDSCYTQAERRILAELIVAGQACEEELEAAGREIAIMEARHREAEGALAAFKTERRIREEIMRLKDDDLRALQAERRGLKRKNTILGFGLAASVAGVLIIAFK